MPKKCRFCDSVLKHTFVDLGVSPLSNAFLKAEQLSAMEPFYPLHAFVCDQCFLVQLEQFETPENIFGDYAYFSSYSDLWLEHARSYTDMIIGRLGLDHRSFVIEIASNDGYLLQNFVAKGIPAMGIEPAANIAAAANKKGIHTMMRFFGKELAEELHAVGKKPDLIIGNNILAHVPDLNDFVSGLKNLLKPHGVITMEFPHLLRLMEGSQFDTIYHEHFSYFSLHTVESVFSAHSLKLFDVEEIPTHGGSLRIYAGHQEDIGLETDGRIFKIKQKESFYGLKRIETYRVFSKKVEETKRTILDFLIKVKSEGKSIAGYGAPAKGNTLLNYCGIRRDFFDYTVDKNPYKQGLFLPGTHISIEAPAKIWETRPDYVFILPWNLKDEIMEQMTCIREWGGKFVVPIPELEII